MFLEILNILRFPFQLVQYMVWTGLDFMVFNVLGLGPYLPITL